MQAIQELYKIGKGPSSSHTLACERACLLYLEQFNDTHHFTVELYGSLSLTGKGHMTDKIIKETLGKDITQIVFKLDWDESFPNGFYILGYNENNELIHKWTVFSIGGGSIQIKEFPVDYNREVYPQKNFAEIKEVLEKEEIDIPTFAYRYEPNLKEHLHNVLHAMIDSVHHGLRLEGLLPGSLNVKRSGKALFEEALKCFDNDERHRLFLMAYAYCASEENASGHKVVTAPTLGACGIMASLMAYATSQMHISEDKLIDALAVAGVFGNVIKQNATISGAVGGCQAEVGVACTMAAAALAYIHDLSLMQIEYAAEIAMEHHLGLTCDPVKGYVIIPCIERNAVAILRSFDAVVLSKYMYKIKSNKVDFDTIVNTMNYTGKMIPYELKETSLGGLATEFKHE